MAAYFTYFPNVYVGEGITDDEAYRYRLVKNIFRRVKVREDLDQYVTAFDAYSIRDTDTPSSLAHQLFQNSKLDWVILLSNNITDFYEQWPKNNNDLLIYIQENYNSEDGVHHLSLIHISEPTRR